ncbi:MAG TPA: type III PLP-dependent enzyme [candidate division Zixibacteria bacterium]|nr:type III PLP-dependent enzyme [candidate division Zixibacteria bacterium]
MTYSIKFSEMEKKALNRGVNLQAVKELFHKREHTTPTLILSRTEIRRNYDTLAATLPRVKIHYAVKPNAHEAIIAEVFNRGGNFDVCSAGEIKKVLKTGIDPKTLIHSHPIKSIPEFDYAVNKGLELFVIDNIDEIDKLKRYNKKLKILIRFRINTNSTAVVNLQYKFGCQTEDVLPFARKIKEIGHEFYGLCFHIGSQCTYSENYVKAIESAHTLINQLDVIGFDTRLLDIGGGFPVEYTELILPIDEFCQPIADALDKHIRPGIHVISEPGRFIAASPITLICSIIGKAERDGKIWYYLDDGLYSTFSGILYDQCQYPVISNATGEHKLSVLAGPTCDSFDVMYDGLMIPEHNIGDKLMFTSTGAYCEVSGSNFNSLRRPDYLVID